MAQPDIGDKAGFVILWFESVKFGNAPDAVPFKEVEVNLENIVREGRFGFLSMLTYGVNWEYNKVSINGTEIGSLHITTSYEWRVDTFVVPTDIIHDGINTFRIESGKRTGPYTDPAVDDIDDFEVKDPILFFAVPSPPPPPIKK